MLLLRKQQYAVTMETLVTLRLLLLCVCLKTFSGTCCHGNTADYHNNNETVNLKVWHHLKTITFYLIYYLQPFKPILLPIHLCAVYTRTPSLSGCKSSPGLELMVKACMFQSFCTKTTNKMAMPTPRVSQYLVFIPLREKHKTFLHFW